LSISDSDIELKYTGSQINYYFVCKRKLWLSAHDIQMEAESDLVHLGKLLHENKYKRKLKEVSIGNIKIDFIEKKNEIHEVKRSRKIENAHKFQLLYYLYYLKKYGIITSGILNYPLLKKTVRVSLTNDKEVKIRETIQKVHDVICKDTPPLAEWKSFCKSCSYSELCWG
jgi:CRISPR-associated exonuclease Cas4